MSEKRKIAIHYTLDDSSLLRCQVTQIPCTDGKTQDGSVCPCLPCQYVWERRRAEAAEAKVKEQDTRWQEIIEEELACTMELFEALGANEAKVKEAGQPIQRVMLEKIAELEADARRWRIVKPMFDLLPCGLWWLPDLDKRLRGDTIEQAIDRLGEES